MEANASQMSLLSLSYQRVFLIYFVYNKISASISELQLYHRVTRCLGLPICDFQFSPHFTSGRYDPLFAVDLPFFDKLLPSINLCFQESVRDGREYCS